MFAIMPVGLGRLAVDALTIAAHIRRGLKIADTRSASDIQLYALIGVLAELVLNLIRQTHTRHAPRIAEGFEALVQRLMTIASAAPVPCGLNRSPPHELAVNLAKLSP